MEEGECRVCHETTWVNGDRRCLTCYQTQPRPIVIHFRRKR